MDGTVAPEGQTRVNKTTFFIITVSVLKGTLGFLSLAGEYYTGTMSNLDRDLL